MSNLDLSLYRSIEALADNDIPNPILRIDFFLHAVITGEECNIEPVTKTEEYLYALATGDESRLGLYGDSISLLEEYLEALRTGDMDNLREPRTREEIILYQAITGEDLGVEPVSRIETYLSMLQNAGGLDYILSTSTSASVIPLTNSINGKARVQEMCGDTVKTRLDVPITDGLVCWLNGFDVTTTNWVDRINGYDFIGYGIVDSDISSEGVTLNTNKYFKYDGQIIDTNQGHTVIVISDVISHISSADCDLFFGSNYSSGTMLIDARNNIRYENGATSSYSSVPSLGSGHRQVAYLHTNDNRIKCVSIKDNSLVESNYRTLTNTRTSMSPVYVGSELGTKNYCNKLVKHIFIYDRELTTEEIRVIDNYYYSGYKLQSCGQDDENGHKIEILSKNGNFIELDNMVSGSFDEYGISHWETSSEIKTEYFIKVPEGCNRVYFDRIIGVNNRIWEYDENKNSLGRSKSTEGADTPIHLSSNVKYIRCRFLTSDISTKIILFFNDKVEPQSNKKEIQLSQPLRGLPNGVRDRIVYLNENTTPIAPEGKGLYLEKNIDEVYFNGSNDEQWSNIANTNGDVYYLSVKLDGLNPNKNVCSVISDKFVGYQGSGYRYDMEMVYAWGNNLLYVHIFKNKLSNQSTSAFREYLRNNPFTVIYHNINPTYTKISDVDFECYENATVYVDSGAVAPIKTVIRYPYKQPALFSL